MKNLAEAHCLDRPPRRALPERWAMLHDYRAIFDEALAEVRQATERADHSSSEWSGPAKARQEISEAIERAARRAP
jgi:hypothetical protein